ncbi:N-acetylmuramoyl-L-alanine amidase, partial [human gut metagenome]
PAVPAEDTAREKPRPAPAPARETAKDTSRSVPSRPAAGEKQAPAAGQGAKAPAAEQPLRYAVQVMASSKAVPLSSSQFRSYRGKVKEYASEGRFPYKYCVGECADRATAQKRLREVRKVFPEAFVVSVRGGRVVK